MRRYRKSFRGVLGRSLDELGGLSESQRIVSSPTVRVRSVSSKGTVLEVRQPPALPPPRELWFQVRQVLRDFILCHPLDTRLWVEYGLDAGSYILVAKPLPLRTQWLAGGSGVQNGRTYEEFPAEPVQYRLAHTADVAHQDLEQVHPFYSVGDYLLAREIKLDEPPLNWSLSGLTVHATLGLVTPADITPASPPTDTIPAGTLVMWLDTNHAARRWTSSGLLEGLRLATDGATSLPVVGWQP